MNYEEYQAYRKSEWDKSLSDKKHQYLGIMKRIRYQRDTNFFNKSLNVDFSELTNLERIRFCACLGLISSIEDFEFGVINANPQVFAPNCDLPLDFAVMKAHSYDEIDFELARKLERKEKQGVYCMAKTTTHSSILGQETSSDILCVVPPQECYTKSFPKNLKFLFIMYNMRGTLENETIANAVSVCQLYEYAKVTKELGIKVPEKFAAARIVVPEFLRKHQPQDNGDNKLTVATTSN